MTQELQAKTTSTTNRTVVKANSLIQLNRYVDETEGTSLSLLEAKLLAMALSLLDTSIPTLQPVRFTVAEFWKMCNSKVTGPRYYAMVGDALLKLRKRASWVEIQNPVTGKRKATTVSWVLKASLLEDGKTVEIIFDPDLAPALLMLRGNYTTYMLQSVMGMQSKYGFALFEQLCSYEYLQKPMEWSLEELAQILDATKYLKDPADMKKRVINVAVNDINDKQSAIHVSYEMKKTGRKFTHVVFNMTRLIGGCASEGKSIPEKSDIIQWVHKQIDYSAIVAKYGSHADSLVDALVYGITSLDRYGDKFASKYAINAVIARERIDAIDHANACALLDSVSPTLDSKSNQRLFLMKCILGKTPGKRPAQKVAEEQDKIKQVREEVKDMIGYNFRLFTCGDNKEAQEALDILVAEIVKLKTRPKEQYIIDKKPFDKEQVLELVNKHLPFIVVNDVIDRYLLYGENIKNRESYLLACLLSELNRREDAIDYLE